MYNFNKNLDKLKKFNNQLKKEEKIISIKLLNIKKNCKKINSDIIELEKLIKNIEKN